MAFIDGLDIIAGLEDAGKAIFSFGSNATQDVIQVLPRTVSRAKYGGLVGKSLLVLWQPLYAGFNSGRRAAWDAYWTTLPFGNHSGANGWPGSGFSAFVYVNAPIYKAGGSLMYDPPIDSGVVVNGAFFGTSAPWGFNPNWSYSANAMHNFAASGSLLLGTTTEGGTIGRDYQVSYDAVTTSPGTIRIDNFGTTGTPITNPNGHISYTIHNMSHTASPFGIAVVADGGWAGSFTNVSVFLLP